MKTRDIQLWMTVFLILFSVFFGSVITIYEDRKSSDRKLERRVLDRSLGSPIFLLKSGIGSLWDLGGDRQTEYQNLDGTLTVDPDSARILTYSILLFLFFGSGSWFVMRLFEEDFEPDWYPGKDTEKPPILVQPKAVEQIQTESITDPDKPRIYAGHAPGNIENHEPLYASTQDRGLVMGASGTGKSAFLKNQAIRWVENSYAHLVIVDVKPKLYSELGGFMEDNGYEVVRWNPKSPAGVSYNPLADIDDEDHLKEFYAGFVPSDEYASDTFADSAQMIFTASTIYLREQAEDPDSVCLPDVFEFIQEKQLAGLLDAFNNLEGGSGYLDVAASKLVSQAENDKLTGGVFNKVYEVIEKYTSDETLDSLRGNGFRYQEFYESTQPIALFLQFPQNKIEQLSDVMAAFFTHSFNQLMSRDRERFPVLQLLDEVGTANRVPNLGAKMNTVRDANLPTWLYFQTKAQIDEYEQVGDPLDGAMDTQIYLRSDDSETARHLEERLGEVEYEVESVQKNPGRDGSIKTSISKQNRTSPIVTQGEAQKFPEKLGVTIMQGKAVWSYFQPYYEHEPEFYDETEDRG